MRIVVLGTGMVGRTLAARLTELNHDVSIGTRDVEQTLARSEPDAKGSAPYTEWQKLNPTVRLVPFENAGTHGDLIINATAGAQSLTVLHLVGAESLVGKVLLDLAVPLDYSQGRPPRLLFANDDSLGEQIQRALPGTHVVKTLNTMHMNVMTDPSRVPGDHNVFLAGDDDRAKTIVKALLAEFGWPTAAMVDLGGIRQSRATEMYAPLLFSLMGLFDTSDLNIAVCHPGS
ncbi:NAD(P)-binding domain-containing protein [Sphingomonas sp. LB2R24]|uniref:NADPH-dependent F420 reductase n=1 Tax=Sphingomonas sorbitolis TaxID=3096165 RepID=UPI002FC864ED